MKIVSAQEAVKSIQSGHKVFVHTAAATPTLLVQAMTDRHEELSNVHIYHLHTEGPAPYVDAKFKGIFHTHAFFVGSNLRKAIETGHADYIPIFLSEIPRLFHKRIIDLDVALIRVSPPDQHGYCSLGVSVDASRAAVQTADIVIAELNPYMPRTHGDGIIHQSEIDFAIESDAPMHLHPPAELSDTERNIGRYCASLIEDGATLQMGIGAIPDAVLASLTNHKNLGIHTEMFSDGVLPLLEAGIVNNSQKSVHPGKVVATFAMGTEKLYQFMHDNPLIAMLDVAYVNDTKVIRKNPKVTAINSAIEVDLTGQICADSIGMKQYSGVGGQMDFIRGASLSDDGKPIIALPSTTRNGISRIAPFLNKGAGVVTTRAHAHYIVTEYGIANLYGKGLRERATELIRIAHPEHREILEKAAYERFKS